jgi:hypothetical protein
MEIDKTEVVKVNVKTLKIHCKVSDRFTASLVSASGTVVHEQDDGYVPGFMPGPHYGDYIVLDIDIDTGMVTNWEKPTANEIQEWIKGEEE